MANNSVSSILLKLQSFSKARGFAKLIGLAYVLLIGWIG